MEPEYKTKRGVASTTLGAGRASTIGWSAASLRPARSDHFLSYNSAQNARIDVLLGEMRPTTTSRKSRTTHVVDASQIGSHTIGGRGIYGSWQDRRPMYGTQGYGSRNLVGGSSVSVAPLPKYDQLYCNTSSSSMGSVPGVTSYSRIGGSTNTIGRRDPPEYSRVQAYASPWQMTASETRPQQAGWLRHPRPLARGTLSPVSYFKDLEQKHGPNSPISTTGLAVVTAKMSSVSSRSTDLDNIRTSSSDSTLDSENNTLDTTAASRRSVATGSVVATTTTAGSTATLSRSTPRQASFIAAVARHPLKETTSAECNAATSSSSEVAEKTLEAEETEETDVDGTLIETTETLKVVDVGATVAVTSKSDDTVLTTPVRRPRRRGSPFRRNHSSRSMGRLDLEMWKNREDSMEVVKLRSWKRDEGGEGEGEGGSEQQRKEASDTQQRNSVDTSHEAMKMMRRARPKSYVLATSASMNDDVLMHVGISNEGSSTISHDETTSGREVSSSMMGSTSSMEQKQAAAGGGHTSRSLNAPHPPATHRLQRFIALFNSNKSEDSKSKPSRMKRSRTSLPASRFSLPGTVLQRESIDRQTWIKHQELALGKKGKSHYWEDRWAILYQRTLYLCIDSPAFNTEKTVELGAHTRVDVRSSIVDIAYDWLSSTTSKQRHVVRIVTQTRTEHLIELNTESEMLSWISMLQSSSEDDVFTSPSPYIMSNASSCHKNMHNSQSIASLASSSCSTTASEQVALSPATASTDSAAIAAANTSYLLRKAANESGVGGRESSSQVGGLSQSKSAHNFGTSDTAKNQLIMHRYIAKSSQLQSPTANKRMDGVGGGGACAVQAGTSKEAADENGGEATTPKSGRKWKKSKAGKQGSGGGSSGSSSGSQHHATGPSSSGGGPAAAVLGVRLADCPIGTCDDHVPLLVQICVCVVETHGMDTVGIYRIPGNTAAVNALKESLSNAGFENINPHNVESLDPRWRDVNVVSSLLKMFLRKLPEPLLTDKLYPFFIDANRIATHHNRLHKLRNLLRKLPRPHYDTLRYLIVHLSEITKHSHVNKMECRNLALMFGPSIVRPSDDNMATMVTHMSDQCKIIETLIHYNVWMFDENSTMEDAVPEQHPTDGANALEPGSYGVGVPTGVSAASFNDMHNLIRKANEDQAAAMMNEGKGGKIKNMLRRNSRRDKSKSKPKIESTAAAAVNPRGGSGWTQPTPSSTSAASVESAFCGNYQERDIDAEIESRQTVSPLMTSGSADGVDISVSTTTSHRHLLDQSPSLESSVGSLPDTSRTEPIGIGYVVDRSTDSDGGEAARRRRQEEMYSARRIFIAGTAAAASTGDDKAAIDALANHSQHLHLASSPAFEVLSEETREKIRRMQKKQNWHQNETKDIFKSNDFLKTYSPTKDVTDALSCTSDYSTTSSAPLSTNPPLAVACADQPNSSSDYASSDPSPCTRNASASPAIRVRPANLGIVVPNSNSTTATMSRSQKIRMRTKAGNRDPARRHTLSDVDTLKEGRLDKLARWFGIRKSSPDVTRDDGNVEEKKKSLEGAESATVIGQPEGAESTTVIGQPPLIVRTSPNELTPVSGDELL